MNLSRLNKKLKKRLGETDDPPAGGHFVRSEDVDGPGGTLLRRRHDSTSPPGGAAPSEG